MQKYWLERLEYWTVHLPRLMPTFVPDRSIWMQHAAVNTSKYPSPTRRLHFNWPNDGMALRQYLVSIISIDMALNVLIRNHMNRRFLKIGLQPSGKCHIEHIMMCSVLTAHSVGSKHYPQSAWLVYFMLVIFTIFSRWLQLLAVRNISKHIFATARPTVVEIRLDVLNCLAKSN